MKRIIYGGIGAALGAVGGPLIITALYRANGPYASFAVLGDWLTDMAIASLAGASLCGAIGVAVGSKHVEND